jgi:hypothetical protein
VVARGARYLPAAASAALLAFKAELKSERKSTTLLRAPIKTSVLFAVRSGAARRSMRQRALHDR